MDYVVFGIGFGATLLVFGLLVRDIGPRLRYRRPADPDGIFHAEELVAKVSWSRFCGALGTVLAIGGALFVLITAICMLLMLSDSTGGWVMLGSLAVLVLLVAFWTWAFFDRFGSYGILPEREVEEEPPVVKPARPARPDRREDRRVRDEPETAVGGADTTVEEEEGEAVVVGPPLPEDTITIEVPREDEPPSEDDGRDEAETASEASPGDESSTRLQTPEERLAASDTPIDHGSTEGDLGIGTTRPRRPAHRSLSKRVKPKPPEEVPNADDASAETHDADTRDSDTNATDTR